MHRGNRIKEISQRRSFLKNILKLSKMFSRRRRKGILEEAA